MHVVAFRDEAIANSKDNKKHNLLYLYLFNVSNGCLKGLCHEMNFC
jgi:hypothetical protein